VLQAALRSRQLLPAIKNKKSFLYSFNNRSAVKVTAAKAAVHINN
jgi:hypothetical protein